MKLIWMLFIFWTDISTALNTGDRYGTTRATKGIIENNLLSNSVRIPALTSRDVHWSHKLSLRDSRSLRDVHNRTEQLRRRTIGSSVPPNKLQRRGGGGKKDQGGEKKSKKRKQSASNKLEQQLRHQRSGSGYQLSNSASAGSLGVEGGGISKPIPKRLSDKQLGRDRSVEYLKSLGVNSASDLGSLGAGGGSNENLFAWANPQATGGGFGSAPSALTQQNMPGGHSPPPLRRHQTMDARFGSVASLHNYPQMNHGHGSPSGTHTTQQEQNQFGGIPDTPRSAQRPNSNASSRSGSHMSIDLAEEVQGRLKLQRLRGVGDLTMIDAWPYARERMKMGDSPPTSEWETSSEERGSGDRRSGSVNSGGNGSGGMRSGDRSSGRAGSRSSGMLSP